MKKIIFCIISVISISLLTLCGCNETDPVESFYDKYQLTHVNCNYYKYGSSRSETYTNPKRNLSLGSTEQNEFYSEVYDFLGAYLKFENEYIYFGGKIETPVAYSYYNVLDDGSFRFKFDNIFGEQTGTVRKFLYDGRTSVWLNYENNTVKSRQITISSHLYVDGQGPLDFKPVAVFEFVFSNKS